MKPFWISRLGGLTGLVGLTGLACLTSGCAPDRNLEQFNADKRREHLQRIQEVSGVYRGQIDLSSGRGWTGLELQIEATTDALGSDPRATVRGVVRVGLSNRIQVGFSQAAYDPETHDLVLQIPLELMGTSRDQLLLRGTIFGKEFHGAVGFETHDSQWSTVVLVKDAAIPESSIDFSTLASFDRVEGQAFAGSGNPMKTWVSLSEVRVTNQQMLFNFLSNTRLVSVVISFGDSVTFALSGEFNGREGILRASALLPSPAALSELLCAPSDSIWQCTWHTAVGSVPVEFGRVPFSP